MWLMFLFVASAILNKYILILSYLISFHLICPSHLIFVNIHMRLSAINHTIISFDEIPVFDIYEMISVQADAIII